MEQNKSATCPIPGCNMNYSRGILGWHKHVERKDAHPFWHPELDGATARKAAFVEEFQDWFENAVGHQTPAALRLSSKPAPAKSDRVPRATATAPKFPEREETGPHTPLAKRVPTAAEVDAAFSRGEIREVMGRILDLLVVLEARVQ